MSAPIMNHSRRETLTTSSSGPSIKRKERESNLNVLKPSPLTTKRLARPSPHHRPSAPAPFKSSHLAHQSHPQPQLQPLSNNQLLAGYLAHEFLSKGTLLGQPWDPARAEAAPVSGSRFKPGFNNNNNRHKGIASEHRKVAPAPAPSSEKEKEAGEKYQRYREVADLLKTDGAHLPGIVNPTQLARFLQLG